MPHEARGDLEVLFIGARGSLSSQDKHLKRAAWVIENLSAVLASLNLVAGPWSVVPLMVLSQPMHSPLLGHAKFAVLTVEQLKTSYLVKCM